jgi:hypothetical protein
MASNVRPKQIKLWLTYRLKASTGGHSNNQQKYCYCALVLAGR